MDSYVSDPLPVRDFSSSLAFDLRYYTEARELGYLLSSLETGPRSQKMEKLNRAMVELVEEYSLVGFETLAVEVSFNLTPLRKQRLTK